jgi:hypothetical protein
LLGCKCFAGGILDVFGYSAGTSSCMDKPREQLDSAHQIGLGSTPHDCLTVVVMVFEGGEVCWGANVLLAEFWTFLPVAPQSMSL